uniref:Ig-like domain-containing protein n=1 Tax=Seriola lalandi dorsalis TaxID=1841481 RepID=A0A3B4WWQ7_SERLL
MDLLLRKTTMICLLLVFSLLLSAVSADRIDALLGESVMFTATKDCSRENAELIHRSRDDNNRTVARYQHGKWSPASGYGDRVDQGDTVTLRITNINDEGLYELTGSKCDETVTDLYVVPFHVVHAAEGQTVTLQCHYVTTTNKKVECAWWEKDGKRVFGTEIKLEAGFEGRVSLPDKDLALGDFSATVQQVRQEDGGNYRCYYLDGGKKKMGTPAATRLAVDEVSPDQIHTRVCDSYPGALCRSSELPDVGLQSHQGNKKFKQLHVSVYLACSHKTCQSQ